MHPLVNLARQAIETYVQTRQVLDPPDGPEYQAPFQPGVFVSVHSKTGELRGCVGTFHSTEQLLAEQVIKSAISACSRDPRFAAIEPWELELLDVNVDVLSPFEPITCPEDLDIKRYGLLVESGWRRGLLLPDIPGVDNVQQQIEIAQMKGGIRHRDPVQMYRFTVQRYTQEGEEPVIPGLTHTP